MATPIPSLVSQLRADATAYAIKATANDIIGSTVGTAVPLSQTYYYYGVSSRSSAGNGQSFLRVLQDAANLSPASLGTWVVKLTSGFKVNLSHGDPDSNVFQFLDSASAVSAVFAALFGFTSGDLTVPTGAGGLTGTNKPRWWWSPEMPICGTGPVLFDPSLQVGIPSALTTAQRSSDGSMAFTSNGVLVDAEYLFPGVNPYWRIRPQSGYTNEDLDGWWQAGPALGNRVLLWRNRDNATGSAAPGGGSASPYNYVQYYPAEKLAKDFPAKEMAPGNLYQWDVGFAFNLTEAGEALP